MKIFHHFANIWSIFISKFRQLFTICLSILSSVIVFRSCILFHSCMSYTYTYTHIYLELVSQHVYFAASNGILWSIFHSAEAYSQRSYFLSTSVPLRYRSFGWRIYVSSFERNLFSFFQLSTPFPRSKHHRHHATVATHSNTYENGGQRNSETYYSSVSSVEEPLLGASQSRLKSWVQSWWKCWSLPKLDLTPR